MTTASEARPLAARARAVGSAEDVVAALAADLTAGLAGRSAGAVLAFASARYDPATVLQGLAKRFDGVPFIGCSTAGEFTDVGTGTGGVSAIALPAELVLRAETALIDLSGDVVAGTRAAVAAIEERLGAGLRSLDPSTHLGLVLIDGLHGAEEAVNEELGNAAPLLNVVGGSAGDDLAFSETSVSDGDSVSRRGAALMVLRLAVPFRVIKSCSFEGTGTRLRITKADLATRTVHEFDGRPAVEAYCKALGVAPEDVGTDEFMKHPVGLIIDDEPWIRSPQAVDGTSLRFYAQILEGMEVEVMRSTSLVPETESAVRAAVDSLGAPPSGAVMFNCILRRLEMDAENTGDQFVRAFDGIPTAGFHTYGEAWLGHINQTITGVVLGS